MNRDDYKPLHTVFLERRTLAISYVSKIMDAVPGDPVAFSRFVFNDKLVPLLGTNWFLSCIVCHVSFHLVVLFG
jgi:hypothetical protein